MTINPVFINKPETVDDIAARTGLSFDIIHRAARKALAARLVTCRLIGAEMVPEFRKIDEPDGTSR